MGLQVRYKFWKTVSALLRFGNMKSLEMSRLNDSLWAALLSHFQTAKPVWSLFTGCGRPSGCLQSIQRWKIDHLDISLDHIWLLDAGCRRIHSPPPWCPLSTRNGRLGSIWQEKDWRGRNAKGIITVTETDKRISLRWCRVKWCWEGRGLPSSAWSPPSSAACWLSLACRLDWERYFRSQRNFDFQTSTAGLLHISVFLVLTLPAILVNRFLNLFYLFYISMKKVRASKVPVIAPWLDFGADFLGGLGDLCTYRWILVSLA